MAVGIWRDIDELGEVYKPALVVQPVIDESERLAKRERFLEARERASRTIPELSDLHF